MAFLQRGVRYSRQHTAGRGKHFKNTPTSKYSADSALPSVEIFDFPFLRDDRTASYINGNMKVMFILRGPAGTRNHALIDLILEKYPSAIDWTAHHYLSHALAKEYNSEALRNAHGCCKKRVKESCEKGSQLILIRNTHMAVWELVPYLNMARKYGYVVMMAITLRKFLVTPEVLEKTNVSGLDEEYFKMHLKRWEECIPLYTGWFLGEKDSTFVLGKAKETLAALLDDTKFCRVMGACTEDEIWEKYSLERYLFCISSYYGIAQWRRHTDLYVSQTIQDIYGKYFDLTIQGILVTQSEVLAVVELTEEMKKSMCRFGTTHWQGCIEDDTAKDLLRESLCIRCTVTCNTQDTFKKTFSSGESEKQCWESTDCINSNSMSFIVLARNESSSLVISNPDEFGKKIFSSITDEQGRIEEKHFMQLKDSTYYCSLSNAAWFVKVPVKICVGSIFTGWYF